MNEPANNDTNAFRRVFEDVYAEFEGNGAKREDMMTEITKLRIERDTLNYLLNRHCEAANNGETCDVCHRQIGASGDAYDYPLKV